MYRIKDVVNLPLRLVRNHPVFENDILLMDGAKLMARISDIRGDCFERLDSIDATADMIFKAVKEYKEKYNL